MNLNFIDLMWMYSVSCNKLKLPPLNQLGHLEGTGQGLIEKKSRLVKLHGSLKRIMSPAVTAHSAASYH